MALDEVMAMKDENLLMLTDAMIPTSTGMWRDRIAPRHWKLLLAASPSTYRLSKEWRKEMVGTVIYMAEWEWQEIAGAYRLGLHSRNLRLFEMLTGPAG